MRFLAAVGLIGFGWLIVRPGSRGRVQPMTFTDIEIAFFTRTATVIADGRRLLTGGPVEDRAELAMTAAVAFEAQLRAVFRGAKRG